MSTLGGPLTYQGVEGDVKRSVCPMFRSLSLFRSLSKRKKLYVDLACFGTFYRFNTPSNIMHVDLATLQYDMIEISWSIVFVTLQHFHFMDCFKWQVSNGIYKVSHKYNLEIHGII